MGAVIRGSRGENRPLAERGRRLGPLPQIEGFRFAGCIYTLAVYRMARR